MGGDDARPVSLLPHLKRQVVSSFYRFAKPSLAEFFNGLSQEETNANPAETPIERPTKIELIVNLKTARELGLTLPPAILIQATDFIE